MSADGHSDVPEIRTGTCDSCGAPADDLAAVHRVYVTPAAWDTDEDESAARPTPSPGGGWGSDRIDVLDEVERWCFPCRTQYPHQPLSG
ncbi:MAG: hypothetical protein ACRD07_07320 [Acidimicrobiales bacterium]